MLHGSSWGGLLLEVIVFCLFFFFLGGGAIGYSRWPLAVDIVKMEDRVEKCIKDFLL